MNTLILGGATRLPTGNVFGTAWPRDVVVTKNAAQHDTGAAVADARYDAVVYETEPTTGRVAWKLSVTSYETLVQRDQVSEDDVRLRHADEGAPLGWAIASAEERFYDAPAADGCGRRRRPAQGLATHALVRAPTRSASARAGTLSVRCVTLRTGENAKSVSSASVQLPAHWAPAVGDALCGRGGVRFGTTQVRVEAAEELSSSEGSQLLVPLPDVYNSDKTVPPSVAGCRRRHPRRCRRRGPSQSPRAGRACSPRSSQRRCRAPSPRSRRTRSKRSRRPTPRRTRRRTRRPRIQA